MQPLHASTMLFSLCCACMHHTRLNTSPPRVCSSCDDPKTQQGVPQHPSDMTAAPSSSPSWSSASRTPSPSFWQGHEQQRFSRQQQQQQSNQQAAAPISTSPSSPSWRRRSWNSPVGVDDGRAAAAARGGGGDQHFQSSGKSKGLGKWDEEAQARASGSVGKQILQRYLTNLYPKVN